MSRVLVWFSCGAASAVAAKLAVEKYGERCEVLYCDTLAYEHPDNLRFLKDVEAWIGQPIKLLHSEEYADIFDVFRRTGWLIGNKGARCTTEMKKVPRLSYQQPDDIHVFGFTSDEQGRIDKFATNNLDTPTEMILRDSGITKSLCYRMIRQAGIALPAMYLLGYKNNNCIGCVKGGQGYWNKIRKDFPEAFDRMAKLEREMNVSILKDRRGGVRKRLFLDELERGVGSYASEPDIECGVLCHVPEKEVWE